MLSSSSISASNLIMKANHYQFVVTMRSDGTHYGVITICKAVDAGVLMLGRRLSTLSTLHTARHDELTVGLTVPKSLHRLLPIDFKNDFDSWREPRRELCRPVS